MSVTITVPEKTTAGFVIATDQVPGDLPALLRERLPGASAPTALHRLGTPRLTITGHPAADSPWDLDPVTGDAEDVERLHQATRHIGVTSVLEVGDLPVGLHLSRTVAKAIAESLGGVPVDTDTSSVLPIVPFGPLNEFVLADEWLGASLPPYRDAGRCRAAEADIDGCSCVDLATTGLRRFGLPELEITDVACAQDLAALNLIRSAAQRLLPLGRHRGEHVLASEILLTGDDLAAYWGCREPVWDDGPVAVRLTEVAPGRIRLAAPAGFPGTLNEWLWDELPPILHELLSCEPDPHP
ncbi:hypothetical protein [Spirillospora albida]|uniref:hypothetical protein n=1 Tax=Spirillospora albida TaxID=58123 RepID=UPI0004C00E53|nr:hypothetical protein [Spirillospora albida]